MGIRDRSKDLQCNVRRGGKEYSIGFKGGQLASKLKEVGTVGQKNTGTTVRFWPDPKFFDSDRFQSQVQRSRAGIRGHRMGCVHGLCKLLLELLRPLPRRQPAGAQRLSDRANFLFADLRKMKWDRVFTHGALTSEWFRDNGCRATALR